GCHESGYTEFTLDISKHIKPGKNFIAVMVDNRSLITKWPNDRGYFSYGGIHRDVYLELYDDVYLEALSVTPVYIPEEGCGAVELSGVLRGRESAEISIALGRTERMLHISEGRFTTTEKYESVSCWSPESPTIYDFSVSLDGEKYFCNPIGFRSVETKDGSFFLNGKDYHLNGCCYVYDSPSYGLVMEEGQLAFDLSEMKAAGVNAIRTHFPMDDKFYNMCDKMGFLVWIEPNIYCCKPSKDQTQTPFAEHESVRVAFSMTSEMIASARCHPCVAIYALGNECNVEHPEAIEFFRNLAALVRETDSTRLVGYAALYGLVGSIGEVLDIIGINSYYGWYDKIGDIYEHKNKAASDGFVEQEKVDLSEFHSMIDKALLRLPPELPLLLTEFGADSLPGFHSSCLDLWSEEYHAEVIKEMINASRKHERICGTFVFAFIDYMDPCKPLNGFWKGENLKGMLSYQRDRKQPFYALQKVYTDSSTDND
ncbi:MAG: hypothetical protein GX633_02470, partial [Clostridiales bacterium]|nr:hypothetical protein [Clostridiales bacterium]